MDDDQYTRITLRIPKTLHAAVTRHAFATSKSQNAEIIGRLQSTFDSPLQSLPSPVVEAVQREVAAHGGTPEEALTRLVQAGEQRSGLVLNLSIQKGMTVHELTQLLQKVTASLPAETEVIIRHPA